MFNGEVKLYGEDSGIYLQCSREECAEKLAGMQNSVPFEKWVGDTVTMNGLVKAYNEHIKRHRHDHTCSPECEASEEHMRAMEEDVDRQLKELSE